MVDEVTSRLARQRPDQRLAPDAKDKIIAALVGAADPMGAGSTLVSNFSPDTAQWMRDAQSSHPGMANVGAMLTGGAALNAAPRLIGTVLGVGGGMALNAPEVEAQKSGAAPKRPATQEELIGQVERQKAPGYNPLEEARAKIRELESRISTNTGKVASINSAPLPGRRDRVAAATEGRSTASAPLNTQIRDDQEEVKALRGIEKQLQEIDRPAREAYPYAGAATVVGGTLASAALSRYGMGKVAHGIDDAVKAATKAGNPFNSVEFIRQAKIAGDRAGSAPAKKIATALMAASLPADIQAAVDASDYKGKPKWTRAYKEAEQQFSDPVAYLKSLGPAALSGIAGAALGYKMAPTGQADTARRLGDTARQFEPRGTLGRMVYGYSAPEAIAPSYAKAVGEAAKLDAKTQKKLSSVRSVPTSLSGPPTGIQGEILDAGQPAGRGLLPAPEAVPSRGGRGYPLTKSEEAELRAMIVRQLMQP